MFATDKQKEFLRSWYNKEKYSLSISKEKFEKRTKIISDLYDILFEKADKIIKKTNPCKIKCGKCFRAQRYNVENAFCCDAYSTFFTKIPECKYLTKNGCSAEKPLYCRVWFCDTLKDHTDFPKELSDIWDIFCCIFYREFGWGHMINDNAHNNGLINRFSKKEAMEEFAKTTVFFKLDWTLYENLIKIFNI